MSCSTDELRAYARRPGVHWSDIVRTLISALWTMAVIWFAMILHNVVASAVRGGSLDPRCIYGVRGYVEIHSYQAGTGAETVTCRYRPFLGTKGPPVVTD